ncbi:hypothetical protein [Cytobacillus oceanisediminis]|uniref:Transposase n=1 Tax=Cytobacillus oceanisediminis TaxID=665099 RepID=A0ABX3CJV0_9BACI|nr:hypothetical protein [Cytobacillus oceanisediminis]OHX41341.1 hypothetical protein BBV17_28505 [Cytobacillus oceanisediminis]
MGSHEYRNGCLIQTDKKFSALTKKQKDWITKELKERYIQKMKYSDVKLRPNKRDQVLYEVYAMIEEKKIWVPFDEVKKYYYSNISSFIRSHRKQQNED